MSLVAAFDAVVGVAHSAIEGLSTLLTPTVGGLAAALAIVVCTILVRLLISPLSWLQARSAKRGAALAPEIAKLREKHKDDPVKLAGETLALQRANGAGPGTSLLPALVQAPFFMIMFRLVQPGAGAPSGLLAGNLFGVPLTAHLTTGLPIFAVLLAIATGLAIWTSRRARKALAPPAPKGTRGDSPKGMDGGGALPVGGLARVDYGGPATVGREPLGAVAGAQEGARAARAGTPKGTPARAPKQAAGVAKSTGAGNRAGTGGAAGLAAAEGAAPLVGRLLGVLPYLTVLMVAYLPLAGALYLVTSTAWTALEQALWRRPAVGTNR
jgi:YidC/Oxa1 family membrane protein insertase